MSSSERPGTLSPTVDMLPPIGSPRTDESWARVGLVERSRPRFSQETARLLRARLTAATLALSAVVAAAFLMNLFTPAVPLVWLRGLILVGIVGSFAALVSRWQFSLAQLRGIELGVFGAIVLQLLLMMHARLLQAAAADDPILAISAKHGYLSTWGMLLLVYAMLMPNSWRRAAALLLPTACAPYGLLFWLQTSHAQVARVLSVDEPIGLPIPLVAACVAVFGAHVIHAARREAFKARQLGQYVLKRPLGSGGMGEVYEAEHRLLKRPCAIKLIKPGKIADPTALARFEREVQATARLTHWNTVEIFDYGHTDDGTFYYVMELLPGMSFEDLVTRYGAVPPERAVHFLLQAAAALGEAHAKGLVHRDIKPANLFASERGGVFDVVKVLDFGLVRQESSQTDLRLTQPGTFNGSPLYMCPEQSRAYDKLDARSDIYSLGAVAYWLVTGRPPFTGNTVWEIIAAHARDPVTPPRDVNPSIPEDLERVIIRALAKMPANRFPDAQSLAEALGQCQCAGKWTNTHASQWWRSIAATSA